MTIVLDTLERLGGQLRETTPGFLSEVIDDDI